MMKRNPEKFPCKDHPEKYVTLDDCSMCQYSSKCDIYATMLDETEIEED